METKKLSGKALVLQIDRAYFRVALTTLGPSAQLQHCTVFPTPEGAVEDGVLLKPEALLETLKAALARPEFRRVRQVVFTLCSSQVFSQSVRVPAAAERQLEKVLMANMDLYFPVNSEEYSFVWTVTGEVPGDGGGSEMDVLLWAVPGSLLRGYYTLANQCGLTVAAVDYFGHSAATAAGAAFEFRPAARKTAAKREKREKKAARGGAVEPALSEGGGTAVATQAAADTVLYLLAEPEHLVMTFVQDGQVRLQRLLQMGGDLSEAQIALDYFRSMEAGRGARVQAEVFGALAGDAAFVGALSEALELPASVRGGQPGPEWAGCLGAAQTRMDFGSPEQNRTSRGTKKKTVSRAWQYGLIVAGGAMLIGAVLLVFGSKAVWDSELSNLKSRRNSLQIQAAENQGYASRYQDYVSLYQRYSGDYDALFASLNTYNNNLVLVMEELEELLPSGTTVTGVMISDSGLSLNLNCTDKEEAAYLIMRLRSMNYASLEGISNLTINGLTAAAVASGARTSELPPTTGSSDGGSGGSTADYAAILGALVQSSGSSTGSGSYADLWKVALDKGLVTEESMQAALMNLTPEELDVLEQAYGSAPSSQYQYEELLKSATFDQRAKALETMLNEDQIGAYRFFLLLQDDIMRPAGTEILFPYISDDLWANSDVLLGAASGDGDTLQTLLPVLVEMVTKDEETLSAAERLILTDDALSGRMAYYLAVQMGRQQKQEGVGSLDTEKLFADLENGTVSPEVQDILLSILSDMTGSDASELLALLFGQTGGEDSGTGQEPSGEQTGTTVPGSLDELLELYQSGQLDNETISEVLGQYTDGQSGQSSLDEILARYMGGTSSDDALESLVQGYLNGSGGSTGTAGGSEAVQPAQAEGVDFSVVLQYSPELLLEELERKGLSQADKVDKLEVGE